MRGLLVVLSGSSGSGKGTLRRELLRYRTDTTYCVSATTREPRPGEVDGVDYFFFSRTEFLRKIDEGAFCEWADVYGNLYGTLRQPLESWLTDGRVVMAEKDVVGAKTLMSRYPDGVYVFIMPPSLSELKRRLISRRTEADDALQRRLAAVSRELAHSRRYDYLVVNDDVKTATDRLNAVVEAELHRPWRVCMPEDMILER